MLPLSVPALICAPSQTPEAKLAQLAPELQTAVAELKRLGYRLRHAGTVFQRQSAAELKRPDSPHILVVLLQQDQVKLHLNILLNEALYNQQQTLIPKLARAFPGLQQFYTDSGNNERLANLSFATTVPIPHKAWYAENLSMLDEAAEQLLGKSKSRLDKLTLEETFKSKIEEQLKLVTETGFAVTRVAKLAYAGRRPPYFVQLRVQDFKGNESTVAFFFQEGAILYTTKTELSVPQKCETVEQVLSPDLRQYLPEAEIAFLTPQDKPDSCTIKLSYSLAASEHISLVRQLQHFELAHFLLAQKITTPIKRPVR